MRSLRWLLLALLLLAAVWEPERESAPDWESLQRTLYSAWEE